MGHILKFVGLQGYLLCELYRVPEEDPRLEHLSKMQPNNPLQEEIVE